MSRVKVEIKQGMLVNATYGLKSKCNKTTYNGMIQNKVNLTTDWTDNRRQQETTGNNKVCKLNEKNITANNDQKEGGGKKVRIYLSMYVCFQTTLFHAILY